MIVMINPVCDLQLCVHLRVSTEADASDQTGVTAVQDGADTTAPGELKRHPHSGPVTYITVT